MVFTIISSGSANSMPTIPHSHPQKRNATKTATGLSCTERPNTIGVNRNPSSAVMTSDAPADDATIGSPRFGEFFGSGDLQTHHRLVADDPAVVTRGDVVHVAGAELDLRTVVQTDAEPSGEQVADVMDLTAFAADERPEGIGAGGRDAAGNDNRSPEKGGGG